jgi:hypothetical protein
MFIVQNNLIIEESIQNNFSFLAHFVCFFGLLLRKGQLIVIVSG